MYNDSTGTEWQVWDIVPRIHERRNVETADRRVEIIPIAFADRRRVENARRSKSGIRRGYLRGSFAHGWLCFESQHEKRRLSPIPNDWTSCDDDRLEAYSRSAERVPGGGRPVSLSDEAPVAEAG
jgi:hypothetical protein